MNVQIAPVQGNTDAAYRHFHSQIYGHGFTYYIPFIRLEKNGLRPKDYKELTSELNNNHHIIPQIIFRDSNELKSLIDLIKKEGFREIDLNMGCPFPLQTGHGRGAATIHKTSLGEEIVKIVNENPDIIFSVKMRLGLKKPDEWKDILPYLNSINLHHITLHPRTAAQQYKGELDLENFQSFLNESTNNVIFNGEIKTPDDYRQIISLMPSISGVMMGRGLLGRPSLAGEIVEGKEVPKKDRIMKMLEFHNILFIHYNSNLCGDSQILSKIKPFWEYAEEEIGRLAWKSIKKATNIAKYQTAVASIK